MQNPNVYIFSSSNLSGKTTISPTLLSKAKAGDQAALGDIYNLFFKKIYRFIYYRVSHKETAEDLAEDVFLKAFGKIHTVRNDEAFEGWLYQIARNAVIDHYREKRPTVALDEVENQLEYDSNIIEAVNLDQDQRLILSALKELTAEQQIVIKLKFFEHLENPTIAEMLGKQEGAIRVIQHRGITKLQSIIKQRINPNNEQGQR